MQLIRSTFCFRTEAAPVQCKWRHNLAFYFHGFQKLENYFISLVKLSLCYTTPRVSNLLLDRKDAITSHH